MRKGFLLLLVFSMTAVQGIFAQDKQITVEDIWGNYSFFPASVAGFNFLQDGKHYTKKEGANIVKYDLTTGEAVGNIIDGEALKTANTDFSGTYSSYRFSDDESMVLLETEREQIYRHSSRGNFYLWDTKSKKLTPVSDGGKQRYATLNPQGDKLAFVRDNNLYYVDLKTKKEVQVTKDGKANAIINGATDWVYEEEFSFARAFQWSADGKKIAFLRFDESDVKQFTMTLHKDELYPEYSSFKYPKAGEDNARVTSHIYNVETQKTLHVNLSEKPDMYIPRIKWTQGDKLCVFHMNRHQNELNLHLVDATTGKTSLLLSEKNKYYIDIDNDLTFLKDGSGFVWTSEKDGYNHIYLYDMAGKLKKQLTKGKFDVTRFYGVDEKNGLVYFQSAEVSPVERHIYSVDLKGKKKMKLSQEAGTNNAQFSGNFDYYVNTYSSVNSPAVYAVYDRKGELLRTIEDNKKLKEKMAAYKVSPVEFFDFETADKVTLNGWMMKPPNFDANKEYPVFMYVYGGPGSQTAQNNFGGFNYFWFQLLAQKGYIVVSVDNRGTGARGEEFKKMTYQQLGKFEAIDQIAAATYLADKPFVDAGRIGIFGWSYGGYLSSLCILKGNDVFKAAIAVAPVTNWKWYDTIYTERYMRTPNENEDGYEDNSPVNYADRLKGSYLLVHGTADDNVHPQNSYEMMNALINANKQFDMYLYPNRNHGIFGGVTRLHLYNKMTNFLLDNL